jgi:DNA mismatch repair ATPase MutS
MYKDRDFDLERDAPAHAGELVQDLELNTLFAALARGDKFLFQVVKAALLASLSDPETILFRQEILRDCLKYPEVAKGIYDCAVQAIEAERRNYWGFASRYPNLILHRSLEILGMFLPILRSLREIADRHSNSFKSLGFKRFFEMLQKELDDEYLSMLRHHLTRLAFRHGVLISASLGPGNKAANYVLRETPEPAGSWLSRVIAQRPRGYTYELHPRDEAGHSALSEIRDQGINTAANALAQSAEHILAFFRQVRVELAFYLGCLNLHEMLAEKKEPLSFPTPQNPDRRIHSFTGLYDVCLRLKAQQAVVGNSLVADSKDLVIVTGANQGGKSTFLRSIGLAQLMMQCGMFVPAESLSANVSPGLFTHFKREEDVTMRSGKLDEELSRMSTIVDQLTPNSIILFNESFAATNDREGSQIATQIVQALLDRRIKVFFVTHLYEFARTFYSQIPSNATFLRAERHSDGTRTFKMIEGEPLQTSFGEDLFERIFTRDRNGQPTPE